MAKNNPKPVKIGSSRSKNVPKVTFLCLMETIRRPISTKCNFFMRVMILYYHCICIRSIMSKNNPKLVRIRFSRQ